jgi:hypothetical protein
MEADTNIHQWSYSDVQELVAKMKAALKDKTIHAYIDVYDCPAFPLKAITHQFQDCGIWPKAF